MVLSNLWVAKQLGVDPKTAAKVLVELDDHGFLRLDRFGKITGPTAERGTRYRLTWHPTNDGSPATFENRAWLPKIPPSNAVKKGSSTRELRALERGRKGIERTTFRGVDESARHMLERLQSQRDKGKTATPNEVQPGNA